MEDLAAAEGRVASGSKMFGNRDRLREPGLGTPFLAVVVDAGGGRSDAGHHGDPRWIAGGRGAVGIGEQHATGGQAINVGSVNTFSSPHAVDPVIQIIDRDEKDIGPPRGLGKDPGIADECQGEEEDSFHLEFTQRVSEHRV